MSSVRDVVVIGSGPGGAMTAALLAEAGKSVSLLEEGAKLSQESAPAFGVDEMIQKYRNRGLTVSFGKNRVSYVEGRVVGGGSEVNSGLYHRTPPKVLEDWRRNFGVEEIDENKLEPVYLENERDLSVQVVPSNAPPAARKLFEGAGEKGWKRVTPPRWVKAKADGSLERQSMSKTFLPRFEAAGGELLPNSKVLRFRKFGESFEVDAVDLKNGQLRTVRSKDLFLCAGAVQSPFLLLKSGIRKNVGRQFLLHPTLKIVAKFNDEVNSEGMGVLSDQVKEFENISFGCSASSAAQMSIGLFEHPEERAQLASEWKKLLVVYAMIKPKGSGSVKKIPCFDDPFVSYSLAPSDYELLDRGFQKLSELLFAAGAREIFPAVQGASRLSSANEIEALTQNSKAWNLMTIHIFGSCPMGPSDRGGVVDSFGRVHGHSGLYVNDASLFCTALGVNPQGTIMSLARRNILRYLNKW